MMVVMVITILFSRSYSGTVLIALTTTDRIGSSTTCPWFRVIAGIGLIIKISLTLIAVGTARVFMVVVMMVMVVSSSLVITVVPL